MNSQPAGLMEKKGRDTRDIWPWPLIKRAGQKWKIEKVLASLSFPSFVDFELTTLKVGSVKLFNRLLCLLFACKSSEGKATWLAGEFIQRKVKVLKGLKISKSTAKIIFRG
jgi:hypothetical protein